MRQYALKALMDLGLPGSAIDLNRSIKDHDELEYNRQAGQKLIN
jgi:hypothetical protein